jgi:predicted alpha-1,2-mannosidase
MRTITLIFCLLCLGISHQIAAQDKKYYEYVDPFIGTGGHGHTYPGASVPFGMVQLSPDTRLTGWDGCSAYHYSDSIIYGFSHTHLSGTGCSDYGDILLMPFTGKANFVNNDFSSLFKHANETAIPGYYSVFLDRYKVKVELTATKRAGFHKYTFSEANNAGIIIDLRHRDEVIDSYIEIVSDTEIKGMRRSKAWAADQYVYFVIKFSKPFTSYGIAFDDVVVPGIKVGKGKNIKANFKFKIEDNEPLYIKVGISGVSEEGAAKNLKEEIPDWDFEKIKSKAFSEWNKELGKIEVEGGTKEQLKIFYTALYHTMLNPNIYMDVDGQYRGSDLKIHQAIGYDNYTVFSLWDTYRAAHPLYTILDQKRTSDFINTFINQYINGGILPVWELSGNETFCMIGYHSVSVIADAFIKGINGFDALKAHEA